MSLPITLALGELQAEVTAAAGSVILTMRGTADTVAESGLGELLGRVHAESQRAGPADVVVDMRSLEFMNSSCFKNFITWIVAVRRLSPEQRYRITFRSSAKQHWQKRSLHALSYFGGELVQVEVE